MVADDNTTILPSVVENGGTPKRTGAATGLECRLLTVLFVLMGRGEGMLLFYEDGYHPHHRRRWRRW